MVKNEDRGDEYKGVFKIKHGVYGGFGLKYDDEITIEETFFASDDSEAFKKAYDYAEGISKEYLVGSDGKTTVTMIKLGKPNSEEIDQIELVRNKLENLCSREELKRHIAENLPEGKLVFTVTYLDHILDSIKDN